MTTNENQPKKILIAGLPGAGLKTIKAIVIDNNPPQTLKPMIQKLDFGESLKENLQHRVIIVRCGGENSMQDVFSKGNELIYHNVDSAIFVLDVNEQSNFSIAKYWFTALVNHLHKFSANARIYLLLHKIDLLTDKKNATDYIRATKNLFSTTNLDIFMHETSVFDSSIFYAFKDVIMKEKEEQISVKQYLNQAIKDDSSFLGLAVYSHDGLIIYDTGTLPPYVEISTNVILTSISRIAQELEKDDEVCATILQTKKNTFLIFKAVNSKCVFIGLSKVRPKLGQMLIETDQIVEVLKKALI